MVRSAIDYDAYTEQELLKMKKKDAVEGLTEQEQRFCEFYVQSYNVKSSAVKAGYSGGSLSSIGYKIRQKEMAQRYILWLKARILKNTLVKAADVLDVYIRIAFADITDFIKIKPYTVSLKNEDEIDGQLVKSIKAGQNGVSIELYDKMKALDQLAKYTEDMPKEWKQAIEERRQQLMEQEFELKKKMYDPSSNLKEDDGFIEALKVKAEEIWEK